MGMFGMRKEKGIQISIRNNLRASKQHLIIYKRAKKSSTDLIDGNRSRTFWLSTAEDDHLCISVTGEPGKLTGGMAISIPILIAFEFQSTDRMNVKFEGETMDLTIPPTPLGWKLILRPLKKKTGKLPQQVVSFFDAI